jgi:hypothetical protein
MAPRGRLGLSTFRRKPCPQRRPLPTTHSPGHKRTCPEPPPRGPGGPRFRLRTLLRSFQPGIPVVTPRGGRPAGRPPGQAGFGTPARISDPKLYPINTSYKLSATSLPAPWRRSPERQKLPARHLPAAWPRQTPAPPIARFAMVPAVHRPDLGPGFPFGTYLGRSPRFRAPRPASLVAAADGAQRERGPRKPVDSFAGRLIPA